MIRTVKKKKRKKNIIQCRCSCYYFFFIFVPFAWLFSGALCSDLLSFRLCRSTKEKSKWNKECRTIGRSSLFVCLFACYLRHITTFVQPLFCFYFLQQYSLSLLFPFCFVSLFFAGDALIFLSAKRLLYYKKSQYIKKTLSVVSLEPRIFLRFVREQEHFPT